MPNSLAILRVWAAAAWADGVLHPKEELALRRFLDRATDLTPSQRTLATQLLIAKPDVTIEDEIAPLSQEARADLYRAVMAIMRIDGVVTDDELAFVTRLRDLLELPQALIARLEHE